MLLCVLRLLLVVLVVVVLRSMSASSIDDKSTVHLVVHCMQSYSTVRSGAPLVELSLPILKVHELRSGCQPRK